MIRRSRISTLPLLLALALGAACSDGSGGPTGGNPDAVNLRIETLYLVQATQTRDGTVPLVAGKDAYLRVFAVADRPNTAAPAVRVRFYQGGALKETLTIPAAGGSVPTAVDQASLSTSWNVKIPGSLIQPGLQMVADVDPTNAVAESNEADNAFPASGSPAALNVKAVPTFRMRFVPMHQEDNGRTGRISEANKEAFLEMTRKIHPVMEIDADIRAPYTVRGLGFDPSGNTWSVAVSELDAVRAAEGSDRFYYGVVQTPYNGGGVVGIAAGIPAATALGWDRFPDASATLAHEIGHDWGRRHAPCGGAAGTDPNYPYPQAFIGAFGMDVQTGEVKGPSANTDIMGYCDANFWISDYTYTGILDYRLSHANANRLPATPSLLVWGRIVNGEPVLEPAFQVTTRPSLPSATGPYTVQALDEAGQPVLSLSFAAEAIPDVPEDLRHFAFAVPVSPAQLSRIASLRLTVRGGREARVRASTRSAAAPSRAGIRAAILPPMANVEAAGGGRVAVRWDEATYPMVVVRDRQTGEILSLARGGDAKVFAANRSVELEFSDGVRSVRSGAIAP